MAERGMNRTKIEIEKRRVEQGNRDDALSLNKISKLDELGRLDVEGRMTGSPTMPDADMISLQWRSPTSRRWCILGKPSDVPP